MVMAYIGSGTWAIVRGIQLSRLGDPVCQHIIGLQTGGGGGYVFEDH